MENPKPNLPRLLRATRTAFMTLNQRFFNKHPEKSPLTTAPTQKPKTPTFSAPRAPRFQLKTINFPKSLPIIPLYDSANPKPKITQLSNDTRTPFPEKNRRFPQNHTPKSPFLTAPSPNPKIVFSGQKERFWENSFFDKYSLATLEQFPDNRCIESYCGKFWMNLSPDKQPEMNTPRRLEPFIQTFSSSTVTIRNLMINLSEQEV